MHFLKTKAMTARFVETIQGCAPPTTTITTTTTTLVGLSGS